MRKKRIAILIILVIFIVSSVVLSMFCLSKPKKKQSNTLKIYLLGGPGRLQSTIDEYEKRYADYDKKEVYFNKPEFRKVIENYKKLYNASRKQKDMMGMSGTDGFDGIKTGNVLLSNDPIDMRDTFFEFESLISQALKETQVIDTIPSYNGDRKVVPIVQDSLSISRNTENVEDAYNFIKIAISQDIQKSKDQFQAIPVNKKAARDLENYYSKNLVNQTCEFSKDITIKNMPLSDNFKSYYNRIIDDLDDGQVTNKDVGDMIMQCFEPYFEGKADYESCINILINKVKIYINE